MSHPGPRGIRHPPGSQVVTPKARDKHGRCFQQIYCIIQMKLFKVQVIPKGITSGTKVPVYMLFCDHTNSHAHHVWLIFIA